MPVLPISGYQEKILLTVIVTQSPSAFITHGGVYFSRQAVSSLGQKTKQQQNLKWFNLLQTFHLGSPSRISTRILTFQMPLFLKWERRGERKGQESLWAFISKRCSLVNFLHFDLIQILLSGLGVLNTSSWANLSKSKNVVCWFHPISHPIATPTPPLSKVPQKKERYCPNLQSRGGGTVNVSHIFPPPKGNLRKSLKKCYKYVISKGWFCCSKASAEAGIASHLLPKMQDTSLPTASLLHTTPSH